MRTIDVGDFRVTEAMRAAVNAVLDSGRITYGAYSRQFESRFATMHDSKFGVLSNSGTSSLHVALQALKELNGWKDGDEVIVPAVTFVASVNVVLHNRLTPVLVDIDSRYYEMDESKIENAITERTRAIMPVHLFGQPCAMDAIRDIADLHNLAIIEDSCESMNVNYRNCKVGAWGNVGCFSMYAAHILTTGVGGIAITNNDALAVKMRSLVNHGRDGIYISMDDNKQGAEQREVIAGRFSFESIGHSFRITELEAAIGCAQLDDLDSIIAARQDNASYLYRLLRYDTINYQLPATRPNAEHSWMMFPIVLNNTPKLELMDYLESCGIRTREMLPLTKQPCYRGLWAWRDYPVADWVNRNGFYVGIHQGLTHHDLDYIAEMLKNYFDESR